MRSPLRRSARLAVAVLGLALGVACGPAALFGAPPAPSASATSAPTLVETPRPTAASTPEPGPSAAATGAPAPQPLELRCPQVEVDGWRWFNAEGVAIHLADRYVGGGAAEVRALGPAFEPLAAPMEADPPQYFFWAYDTTTGAGGVLSNVSVTSATIAGEITLETLLETLTASLPPGYEVAESRVVELVEREMGELQIETTSNGMPVVTTVFIGLRDGTEWVMTFTAGAADEPAARRAERRLSAGQFVECLP